MGVRMHILGEICHEEIDWWKCPLVQVETKDGEVVELTSQTKVHEAI
jgi:hypothetical protein